MKKVVLFTILAVVAGCSHYQMEYKGKNAKIRMEGGTYDPQGIMLANGQLERDRAEAYAVRKCADNPRDCYYAGYGAGGGGVYTPDGYMPPVSAGAGSRDSQKAVREDDKNEIKKNKERIEATRKDVKKLIGNQKVIVKKLMTK